MKALFAHDKFCLQVLEGRILLSADPSVPSIPPESISPVAETVVWEEGGPSNEIQSEQSLSQAAASLPDLFDDLFDSAEEDAAPTKTEPAADSSEQQAQDGDGALSASSLDDAATGSDGSGAASEESPSDVSDELILTLTAANPPPAEGEAGSPAAAPAPLMSVSLFGVPEWTEQGQAPAVGAQSVIAPNNPVAGPVESIAPHPTNANIVFIGTVNGGIWRTNNATAANPTWIPLTDQFPSLSIGSIAFSPLDATNNTLFAGVGQFDNGFRGGPATGLLRSTDGGTTWTDLGVNPAHGLNGNRVRAVVPTSIGTPATQVILVASNDGGVFRSTDGGLTFNFISGGAASGLPIGYGNATDLIADPNNNMRFYAAVPGQGAFRSDDGGATWTGINTGLVVAGSNNVELSAHDAGATTVLYAGVVNGSVLSGVFRDAAGGDGVNNDGDGATDEPDETNWVVIGAAPAIHPGSQGFNNFSILADQANANLVYVGGDRQGAAPFVANIFVGNAGTNTWASIVLGGANNSAPHADSRDMVFDLGGNILESDDGGIYRLIAPSTAAQIWTSVNGNLRVAEYYSLGYDSINNILIGGTQDTGSSEQSSAGSLTWNQIRQGDGNTQAVDNTSGVFSVRYTMGNNFGTFVRRIFDNTNSQVGGDVNLGLNGLVAADVNFNGFSIFPYVVNEVAGGRLLIGGQTTFYESTDFGDNLNIITPAGAGAPTAFAYGGRRGGADNPDVAYMGDSNGTIYLRTTSGGAFNPLNNYMGNAPRDIVLDPDDWQRAYVVDANNVFFTPDAGVTWTTLTGNLGSLASGLRSVELFTPTAAAGDDVVLVGGLGGVFRTLDPQAGPVALWTKFGSNLPNAIANDVQYDAANDLLVVGTHGRAAWRITNASDYLAVPAVLIITGDQAFPGQDDLVRLERDANNSLLLNVFINNASNAPDLAVPLSALQQINVDLLGGNDQLLVNGANGLVSVPLGIRYNGGVGADLLQAIADTGASTLYALGPDIGAGRLIQTLNTATETIFFTGLEPVQIRGGGAGSTLTMQAPNSSNAINYGVGPNTLSLTHPVFAGDSSGLVSIDTFETVEFSNYQFSVLNAGAGQDTIHLNNASTPTALERFTVNGDDDTVGDVLILNGVAATVAINSSARTVTGATGAGGNVAVAYGTIEGLTFVAGTTTQLALSGSVDYTVNPSARNDEGSILTDQITLQYRGFTGNRTLRLEGSAPDGELTVNATASGDQISVLPTTGDVRLGKRSLIQRAGSLEHLFLNGLDGKDLFYVTGPQPYTSISVAGGNPTANDLIKIAGDGTSLNAVVGPGLATLTGGGLGTLNLTGLELVSVNVAGGQFTVQSSDQDETVTVTPSGMGSGRVRVASAVSVVYFSSTTQFEMDLLGGNDQLTVNGSPGADTILASGSQVEIVGRQPVLYQNAEFLHLLALGGSDAFTITPAAIPISVDGGDPIAASPGDALTLLTGGQTVTLNPGPESDDGSFQVAGRQPVSFDRVESFTVTGGGPLIVNGTNAPDAITLIARDASTHAGTDGVRDFTVSINATPDFLFIDVATVTVQALAGNDEIVLRTPAPNQADWDVDLTLHGGASSAGDRVVVETPGPVAETVWFTPAGVDHGTLSIVETNPAAATNVLLQAIEDLIYDGETDQDQLTLVGTAGADTTLHQPGLTDDSGRLQLNTWLALHYQSLGAGAVVASDGAGGINTLVYEGTAGADLFIVDQSAIGGEVVLNARIAVQTANTQRLTLVALGGDDTATLVPAIAASPYTDIEVNGGDESSSSGDIVNLVGSNADDAITISGRQVSAGGVTVNGTGVEETRIDALGGTDQITYDGVAGLSEDINLIGTPVAGASKLVVAGVALYSLTQAESFDAHGNDGTAGDTDTLRFTGTNGIDVMNIDLNAAGSVADPILEFLDASGANLLLTLFNYTGFATLNVYGLDGQDFFNIYTGADVGRDLFVDGGLPAGKRRTRPDDTTDVLTVYTVKVPTWPRLTHNAETQNQNSGQIDIVYNNGVRSVIQYDNMEFIDFIKLQ